MKKPFTGGNGGLGGEQRNRGAALIG
ncbi:MAG: hypothetical protein JWM99_5190, partial [Verrucomicrobiales bacterium]|nr:hypothetical protein [Verrucomicrobiales bacterium]